MTVTSHYNVGVLALQGAFIEHIHHFQQCVDDFPQATFTFLEVRTPEQLGSCDALVIPGGESTSISLIAERTGLLTPLFEFVKTGKPIWGTCAGLIFLSKQVINGRQGQQLLGGMDIEVKRNAFGRQLDSFITDLDFSSFVPGCDKFPTVFIRAPVVSQILHGDGDHKEGVIYSKNDYVNDATVEVLHRLDSGLLVAVRQGNKLGTSFHPELSDDVAFHRWFLEEFVVSG